MNTYILEAIILFIAECYLYNRLKDKDKFQKKVNKETKVKYKSVGVVLETRGTITDRGGNKYNKYLISYEIDGIESVSGYLTDTNINLNIGDKIEIEYTLNDLGKPEINTNYKLTKVSKINTFKITEDQYIILAILVFIVNIIVEVFMAGAIKL